MSAFVVADKTINRIVTSMLYLKDDNVDNPLDEMEARTPGGASRLGTKMRDLNVESVNYRYDNDSSMIPTEPYVFAEERVDRIQALKSLGCWLYQCNEGGFDNDPLFKRLQKLRTELAIDIVCDSQAYASAEWG